MMEQGADRAKKATQAVCLLGPFWLVCSVTERLFVRTKLWTQSSLQTRKQPFFGCTGKEQKTLRMEGKKQVQKLQKVETLTSPGPPEESSQKPRLTKLWPTFCSKQHNVHNPISHTKHYPKQTNLKPKEQTNQQSRGIQQPP